jgi:ferric-dicitrate binding protein FerR (iron transport regulator)
MEAREYYTYMFNKYLNNTASDAEVAELIEAWEKKEGTNDWTELIKEVLINANADPNYDKTKWEPAIVEILRHKEERRGRLLTVKWMRWAAAAVFLAVMATTAILLITRTRKIESKTIVANKPQPDIPAGSNRAILKLPSGQQIVLDSAKGKIIQNGSLYVNNLAGKLDYEGKAGAVEYHTLSTPRGGDYKLRLPDGTQVWLNAASSITFPTAFKDAERKVSITGEAYFEVAHNAAKPFVVQTGDMLIRDIGTSFNINAYNDEPSIKTTLVEGLVKLSTGRSEKLLKPGMQGVVKQGEGEIMVTQVNTDDIIAWKNGLIVFDGDIQTIMRQVSRWYDVDVVFNGNISNRHFEGQVPRRSNLSDLLKALSFQDINFTVEEKKIVVKP